MIIPNNNTISPTFAQPKGIGGMNQYEGNDMGGGFYRRMRKQKQDQDQQEKPKSRSDHKVDLVA
jgi:hypothetical protein